MKKLLLSTAVLAFAASVGFSAPASASNLGEQGSITAGGEQEVVDRKKKRKKARKGAGAGSGSGSGSGSR